MYIPHELAQNSTVYSTVLVALYWRYCSRLIDVMWCHHIQFSWTYSSSLELKALAELWHFRRYCFHWKRKFQLLSRWMYPSEIDRLEEYSISQYPYHGNAEVLNSCTSSLFTPWQSCLRPFSTCPVPSRPSLPPTSQSLPLPSFTTVRPPLDTGNYMYLSRRLSLLKMKIKL